MNQYRVKFNFSKNDIKTKLFGKFMIDEFAKMYNFAVDKINPMYESWNKEFDVRFPGVDGFDKKYMDFIKDKHRPILEGVNKAFNSAWVSLFTDDNGCISGKTVFGSTITMTLEEIK